MNTHEIIDFLQTQKNILPVKTKIQYWKYGKYSYRIIPRSDYGLMFLKKGRVNFITENCTITAKVGNIIFLPKGACYEAVFVEESEDYLVNFDVDKFMETELVPKIICQKAPMVCVEHFEKCAEAEQTNNTTEFRKYGQLYLLLDSIAELETEAVSDRFKVFAEAKCLLQSDENITIPEIALRCGVSESGLRKSFKDIEGKSPVQYRLEYRINRAMHLLESTNMSVNEISDRLHFYDTAYFCKIFLAHTGMTPKQYLKNRTL